MSRKVAKYLQGRNEAEYSVLDKILKLYLDGNLEKFLSEYGFWRIEIFPSISKNDNSIQICFNYSCFSAILEFKESYFEYCKYLPGCSADELDESIVKEYYTEGFTFERFIERFSKELNNDERIK